MEEVYNSINLCSLAVAAMLLPLLSFVLILLFCKSGRGGGIAIFNIAVSFILSACLFFAVWNRQPLHEQYTWFVIGQVKFHAGILLNNLSVLMLLLVSGISLLVHIYSIEYMKADAYLHRYWAYLGLFCFAMLGLVIADNLLLVYLFWELVGFASYLLIGFWFSREAAVRANKKAFIMNRIGDLGFLAGIMIVYTQFNTLDLERLFGAGGLVPAALVQGGQWISASHTMPAVWLSIAGAAFVFGSMAKSAQFPLHTWLPDAMEGPTAVSSLIHAATMVAAGIFLLLRIFPLFNGFVLSLITLTGIFTAFMAATIALVQNDIKKILAYSTISQLGYMMLAVGTGAYSSAIFHLATHAFFKCLLFLAAGSVIHAMHHLKEQYNLHTDHQDIRYMGGLRRYMPVTFVTMLLASMALAGLPLTSGYLSKDAILIHVFEWATPGSAAAKAVPYLALLTSWLTVFYIARLLFNVFFGQLNLALPPGAAQPHESPALMKYVLIILALFCLYPVFSLNPLLFEHAWIWSGFNVANELQRVNLFHTLIPVTVNLIALLVIYAAWVVYVKRKGNYFSGRGYLYRFVQNRWYADEVYQVVLVRPLLAVSRLSFVADRRVVDGVVMLVARAGLLFSAIAAWADRHIIDALVNFMGSLSATIGTFARKMQSGRLQHYLLTMLLIVLTFIILSYFSKAIL